MALRLLDSKQIRIKLVSSVYETEPVGPPQPDFLNAVAAVETNLTSQALLARLKAVEKEVGREKGDRWGPRKIDIDLLLFGEHVVEQAGLMVPHSELKNRAFVLVPLQEAAPELTLPSGEKLIDVPVPELRMRQFSSSEELWS